MRTFIFATVCVFILFACKKKQTTPEEPAPSPCPSVDPNSFAGTCWTSYYTTDFSSDGLMTTNQSYLARFPLTSQKDGFCNEILSNKISVNGKTLKIIGSGCNSAYFSNWTEVTGTIVDNWSFSGDSIAFFSFANNTPPPSCSDLQLIPDSINKAAGFTFTINVQNFSSGTAAIGDSLYGKTIESSANFTLNAGINVISLTPSQISSWGKSTSGYVAIYMNNITVANACTRHYKFVKEVQIAKKLVVY